MTIDPNGRQPAPPSSPGHKALGPIFRGWALIALQWAAQQSLACLIPMLFCELLLFPALHWSEVAGSPFGNVGFQVVQALTIGACGSALGVIIGQRSPTARRVALWTWPLPVALLLLLVIRELRTFGAWETFASFFYWDHPGRDPGPLPREIFTYPAWSSSCYSLGAALAHRLDPHKRTPSSAVQ